MNHNEIVAREGWIFIIFFLVIGVILFYFWGYWAALPAVILALFCTYFFRNPKRNISEGNSIVSSPADGRIMDVEEVFEDRFMHDQAIRVRIFLSIFNVHVNRSPLDAEIKWVHRTGNQYLPAYKSDAGTLNVRNYLGLNANGQKVLVVQITGIVARRLVCWVKPGDQLQRGERFGLIRFGSCTELYLPTNAIIEVKAGDKVKGGETNIAKLYE